MSKKSNKHRSEIKKTVDLLIYFTINFSKNDIPYFRIQYKLVWTLFESTEQNSLEARTLIQGLKNNIQQHPLKDPNL